MSPPVDLVFDLDGTISDPLLGISRSMNYALASHGFDEVPQSVITALIGPPLDEAFRSLLPDTAERQVTGLIEKFRERYAEVGFAENTLYDGMSELLATLVAKGASLGVCTSKRVDFAERILDLFDIRHFFRFVDGGDVGVAKTQQLEALASAGLVATSTWMIGDRAVDIRAARSNRLSAAGVLWGYGSLDELTSAGADIVVSTMADLLQLTQSAVSGGEDSTHR